MSSLHEALQCLGPTTWDEVPKEQPELRDYLRDIARKARLIVDSVPEQEQQQQSTPEECDATQHSHDTSHTPGKPYKITPSPARTSTNSNTDTADPELQRQWGKPLKAGNSRDNPYSIPMYKMQAADGKAAWFARRSVHEGMPYSRWKERLSGEMEWTLRMNEARLEKGQAPDRVVRGLGAAKKVEDVSVFGDDDGYGDGGDDGKEALGGVKVFDICAHFPKPTTPRDFVQLCASWGEDMGDDSSGEEVKKGQRRCRNWLSVSKPCVHPDLASYDGYLRGQYESVEFIREVLPARDDKVQGSGKSAKSVTWSDTNLVQHEEQDSQKDKKSPPRVSTESTTPEKRDDKSDGTVDDDETNPYPVEWIMITRSDPGGSIPRWIIEKGTPKSIWGDTVKFLDWARQDQDQDQETPSRESAEDSSSKPATPVQQPPASEEDHAGSDLYGDSVNGSEKGNENDEGEQRTGLIANFAYLVNAGLERYAPKAVLDYVPYQHAYDSTQRISTYNTDDYDDYDDDDDDDDTASFVSTESNPNNLNNDKKNDANASSASVVSDALSRHNIPPMDTMEKEKKENLSSHEKQLAKLAQRKRDVQDKLDAVRTEIEELRIDAGTDDTARDEKREKSDETKEQKKDETKESKDETREVKETREEKNKRKEEEKAKKEEEKARRGKEKEEEKARKDKEKEEEKARKEKEKEEKKKEREKEKEEKRLEKELEKEKKKNDKRKSKEPTPEAEPEAEAKSDAESSSNEKPKETTSSEKEAAQSNTNLSLRSKTPSKSQDDLSQQEAEDSDTRSTTTTTTNKKRQSTSTLTNPNIAQIHKAASNLFAQESKLLKQLGKIERDQIKTASKIDARQQKQQEREEKIRSRLERDQLRSEIDGVKKEVERLRGERQQWMDLVAQVQEENARLKKQQE